MGKHKDLVWQLPACVGAIGVYVVTMMWGASAMVEALIIYFIVAAAIYICK